MFMQERRDDGKREESVDNRWNTGKDFKNWLENGCLLYTSDAADE